MGIFRLLFPRDRSKDTPGLMDAIERAVARVEPMLMHTGNYPEAYRKPVMKALEYARSLALRVPGPVTVDFDSYARDAFVHAIFPSRDNISEAFRTSLAMQEYLREHRSPGDIYALMGMRRREKTTMGMELSGQVIQQDVPQHMVYFISHTIENPAPSEKHAREQIAWSFFDSLVGKVASRVALRKQEMQAQRQELDLLMARLRAANTQERPALESELSRMLNSMPSTANSLDFSNYLDDFKAVLLDPEQHLRLDQSAITLDSMGVRRDNGGATQAVPIIFNELIGFDRRDWTVTLVHCRNIQSETFAARLETAHRMLAI